MSDDNLSSNEGEGIKDLRKNYEAQIAANKELAERLAKFEAKERQASVAEVLKAKGLPEDAASLYTGEDTSEDAVGKWVNQYANVFGVKQEQSGAPAGVPDANALAAQRVSDASFGAGSSVQNTPQGQPVLGNVDELMHAIKTLPMDELVKLGYMPEPGTMFNPARN